LTEIVYKFRSEKNFRSEIFTHMQKQDALFLIKSFFSANEITPENFDENNNYFQAMIDEEILSFNFRNEVLTCSSLIYQFHKSPKPEISAAIFAEAQNESRGEVKYESGNKTLYILQTFTENIEEAEFIESINTLAEAGRNWRIEVLDRVAAKANNG
jgi:hypothetical protein